jgi:hypothetical protein
MGTCAVASVLRRASGRFQIALWVIGDISLGNIVAIFDFGNRAVWVY